MVVSQKLNARHKSQYLGSFGPVNCCGKPSHAAPYYQDVHHTYNCNINHRFTVNFTHIGSVVLQTVIELKKDDRVHVQLTGMNRFTDEKSSYFEGRLVAKLDF